jgi:hypothetical protein
MPTEAPDGEAVASVVVLGLVCTAVAFLLYLNLIAEIGPSRASIITYVNPVVALALGVAILDEHVTTGVVAGLLLILAGSWLSTDGRLPPGLAAIVTRLRGRGTGGAPTARELKQSSGVRRVIRGTLSSFYRYARETRQTSDRAMAEQASFIAVVRLSRRRAESSTRLRP